MAGTEMMAVGANAMLDAIKSNNNLVENRIARDYDYNKWREYVHEIDPKTQVRKLQGAGINPALAMSNGVLTSGTPDSQAPQATPLSYDFSPTQNALMQSVELSQDRLLKDAQRENLDANTQNQLLRNRTQLQRDFMDLLKQYSEVDKNSKEGQLIWSQMQYTQKQLEVFDAQNAADLALKNSQAKEHNAHADYLRAQEAYQKVINQFTPDQQKKITRNLDAQYNEILAAANEHNENAARAAAEKALTDARKDGVDIDNKVAEQIIDARVDEAFYQADERYWKAQNEAKSYSGGYLGKAFPQHLDMKTGDTKYYGRPPSASRKKKAKHKTPSPSIPLQD